MKIVNPDNGKVLNTSVFYANIVYYITGGETERLHECEV